MNTTSLFSTLQAQLPAIFPNRRGVRLVSLEPISDGWECEVYGFRVQDGAGPGEGAGEDFILRMYPGEHAGAADKAAWEFRTLTLLRQAGYPVPRAEYLLTEAGSPFGMPLMVMEFIHGRSLAAVMFTDPAPAARAGGLQTFCELFAALHRLPWQGFAAEEQRARLTTPGELIARELGRLEGYVNRAPLEGFLPVLGWLNAHRAGVVGERVSVTHGDFHPNNILVREDGRAFVIDWTNAALSDYRFDLAWTLILALSYLGEEMRVAILREYERAAAAGAAEGAAWAVPGLAFFEVFACTRRLFSIAASVKYGAERLGMRRGAEETMLSQQEAIRRVYGLLRERTGLAVPEVEDLLEE